LLRRVSLYPSDTEVADERDVSKAKAPDHMPVVWEFEFGRACYAPVIEERAKGETAAESELSGDCV